MRDTLPETNSSPLKMDGWNTHLSFLGQKAYFQGQNGWLRFREGNDLKLESRKFSTKKNS